MQQGQRPADVRKLSRADIKDGALHVKQNKGDTKLRITLEGDLGVIINRISNRKVMGLTLITNEAGEPMTYPMMRGAFDRARTAAILANPDRTKEIKSFQFRDLRAKAGTDKEETGGMSEAQAQLGHTTPTMTAHYVRHRLGKLVKPTK
ncbi:tyrosine-type recombinase/integrase [Collimonas pratensis]|uniref:tyrosine-type recombinase/integrase n=1 Tax=Collimonas pratensis TaxID=279113 RepID=UPI000BFF7B4C|nr:tyrosine-type recombinase/integrase [Collimonas pratensis]